MSGQEYKKYKIVDTHFHIGKYAGSFINYDYADNAIKIVKGMNFIKILTIQNSFFFNLASGIKDTIEFLKKNKNFALGYLVYNPNHIEESINIIEKYCSREDIVGMKIHPEDHLCYIDDPKYEPLWEIARIRNIPVLSHTWNPHVSSSTQKYADALLFEKIIKRYPRLKIILGHAGAKDYYYFNVVAMLKKTGNRNVYVDIAGDIFYRDMISYFVKEIGSGNILFGTDIPWIDPVNTYINLIHADISDMDRRNIFFNNASELFNL